jgi:Spy/CpxP family protein refolding chaperone
LNLDDRQIQVFAEVIEDWKTEYAQAKVDGRRMRKQLTESIAGDVFDSDAAEAALMARTESVGRVHSAMSAGLEQLHGALSPTQRAALAMLVRTGEITL